MLITPRWRMLSRPLQFLRDVRLRELVEKVRSQVADVRLSTCHMSSERLPCDSRHDATRWRSLAGSAATVGRLLTGSSHFWRCPTPLSGSPRLIMVVPTITIMVRWPRVTTQQPG